MTTLVSVVIPSHNRPLMLKRAVNSVLNQTYGDIECIVVDDASNQSTFNIIDSFDDNRLKYYRHDVKKGASASRNTGIKYSKGEFVAFLDDDDEWLSEKTEKQLYLFERLPENYGLVYSWMDYYDQNNCIIEKHHPTLRGNVFHKVLDAQRIGGCPTLLVRREVINKIGTFDESLPRGNDGDFIRRICQQYKVDYIAETLVKVNIGHKSERISSNSRKSIINAIHSEQVKLNKFSVDLINLPKIHAAILIKIANHYSYLGIHNKAYEFEKQAMKFDKRILLKNLYYKLPNFIKPLFSCLYKLVRNLKTLTMFKNING